MTLRLVSQLFQPVLTIPKNAKIKNTEITCKSQKLLLECGLVRPTASGLFTLLPLARRALDKLERLIISCIEETGAQRMSFPSLTATGLWEKTGRLQAGGSELMQVEDRHGKKYLLSPTHEEAVADLLADIGHLSYKQLPIILYQIGAKYRDEHRPKHGLLRAREFRMLDAYGAHADEACARAAYRRLRHAYRKLFDALHLPVRSVVAPSGEMGGSLSHEWQLPVPEGAGEDTLEICASCSHAALPSGEERACEQCGGRTERVPSIEVGHTFVLGTKYSAPLGANYVPSSGPPSPLLMSCYGIGITRLLAAGLEALSSDSCLRWPRGLAPYSVLVVGPAERSKAWSECGWERALHVSRSLAALPRLGGDVLVDDRHHLSVGKRLLMADRMGYPTVVVCGRAALESPPRYELLQAGAGPAPRLLTHEQLLHELAGDAEEDNNIPLVAT